MLLEKLRQVSASVLRIEGEWGGPVRSCCLLTELGVLWAADSQGGSWLGRISSGFLCREQHQEAGPSRGRRQLPHSPS